MYVWRLYFSENRHYALWGLEEGGDTEDESTAGLAMEMVFRSLWALTTDAHHRRRYQYDAGTCGPYPFPQPWP